MKTTETTNATQLSSRRIAMPGMIFNIRLSDAESNGAIVIADVQAVPGGEPPRHVHTLEDEIFIIKEGSITFFIGDDIISAKAGDVVFAPRNVPHHFAITSDLLKATVMATPGNIEHFFRSITKPYDGEAIPSVQIPTQEEITHFVTQTEAYGMQFV